MNHRIGLGHDTHRFTEGRPLKLGGVTIPWSQGLEGHSDADVLLHALIDALLGASGQEDIGEIFPDTDMGTQNRDSAEMLTIILKRVRKRGYRLINVDTIIFAQEPKLGPYKEAIRSRIATLLELPRDAIGVKAKTGEGVGFLGRAEAISAEAIVLIASSSERDEDLVPRPLS